MLDCFSFLGGFGLHAARAGAAHVHLLDQSADAIQAAQRNAAANGLAERCSFEETNVFDWLKANTAVAPHERVIPRFDLIILDPPSFTRNRAAVPDALRGYKEIHLRALKLLKAGGTLATFCCSHHVDAATFQDVILSAAYDTRRILRRTAIYSQSPGSPGHPHDPGDRIPERLCLPVGAVNGGRPAYRGPGRSARAHLAAPARGSMSRSIPMAGGRGSGFRAWFCGLSAAGHGPALQVQGRSLDQRPR